MPTLICPECGSEFHRPACYVKQTQKMYCNSECYFKAKKGVPLKDFGESFWGKVKKTDSCWIWQGAVHSGGYGIVRTGKSTSLSHRVAYQMAKGEIPDGIKVCHDCPGGDNPLCVNPNHLFAGTQKQNRVDASKKHRLRYSPIKLSKIQAAAIRQMYDSGNFSYPDLATIFGVSKSAIYSIINGHSWK